MKLTTITIITTLCLTGCRSLMDKIPSRWDDNQSKVVIDLRQETLHFDCTGDLSAQLNHLSKKVEWFHLYSESKSTNDVDKLMTQMNTTLSEFIDRSKQGPVSPIYCDLKKKIMINQIDIIAKTVHRRF